MLTLFSAPGTVALAVHIALEEVGADYALRRVDMAAGEQRTPDYLKINPLGRVPALQTDRGILTEAPAILAYLAQTFPAAGLAPLDDPFAFARAQAFNTYLCSTLHVAHAHGRRGARWADAAEAIEEMKRKMPETVAAAFTLVENDMFEGPWVMGETYSICDPYLFTVGRWMEGDQVDPKGFPKILAHRERMLERRAVQAALRQAEG